MFIEKHLNSINLDLRNSKNGRWIDQKCTPDVTCAVAESILEFCRTNDIHYFSQTDIRESYFASFIVSGVFNKPLIEDAPNEYDKFFSQPIKMLANAQILREDSSSRPFTYFIQELDILLRISQRNRYAKDFIYDYIMKVLIDSNMSNDFNRFFDNPNSDNFHLLKDNYCEFIINNTTTNEYGASGSADAKYISRTVTLADGLDAEDLKIFVNAWKPAGTDVKVFAKVLNQADGTSFTDANWRHEF